jgi:hypothetical protein
MRTPMASSLLAVGHTVAKIRAVVEPLPADLPVAGTVVVVLLEALCYLAVFAAVSLPRLLVSIKAGTLLAHLQP